MTTIEDTASIGVTGTQSVATETTLTDTSTPSTSSLLVTATALNQFNSTLGVFRSVLSSAAQDVEDAVEAVEEDPSAQALAQALAKALEAARLALEELANLPASVPVDMEGPPPEMPPPAGREPSFADLASAERHLLRQMERRRLSGPGNGLDQALVAALTAGPPGGPPGGPAGSAASSLPPGLRMVLGAWSALDDLARSLRAVPAVPDEAEPPQQLERPSVPPADLIERVGRTTEELLALGLAGAAMTRVAGTQVPPASAFVVNPLAMGAPAVPAARPPAGGEPSSLEYARQAMAVNTWLDARYTDPGGRSKDRAARAAERARNGDAAEAGESVSSTRGSGSRRRDGADKDPTA